MIIFTLISCYFLHAGSVADHKSTLKDLHIKLTSYEYQLGQLQKKKGELRPGDGLEEVILRITDLHREILTIKKQRKKMRSHLVDEHPESDLAYDVSLYKDYKKKRGNNKPKTPLDEKLDRLLISVQSQYGEMMTYKAVSESEMQPLQVDFSKAKAKAKKNKRKKYIQDRMKLELEVE